MDDAAAAHDGLAGDGWAVRSLDAGDGDGTRSFTCYQATRGRYTAVAPDLVTLSAMMADYDRHGAPPDYDRAASVR